MRRSSSSPRPPFRRLLVLFGWTRHSSVLLGGFLLVCGLIVYLWWPLAVEAARFVDWKGAWWRAFDWLLVGIFAFLSLTIVSRADLRSDALIVFVGAFGGLVIESWGTQTNLWFYYTAERPPLWILPAWPVASLSIDRITRLLDFFIKKSLRNPKSYHPRRGPDLGDSPTTGVVGLRATETKGYDSKNANGISPFVFRFLYWTIFPAFYAYMLYFVAPTFEKPFTLVALLLCAAFILTPTDHRRAVLTFLAGSGLGYFLERWGTTRQCWTYYTFQTPPLFAVLAHGMAAAAFWRARLLVELALETVRAGFRFGWRRAAAQPGSPPDE